MIPENKSQFPSYQEFLDSIGCRKKDGCLKAVDHYMTYVVPLGVVNHEDLIPKCFIQDYEEIMFQGVVGQRS